VTSRAGRDLPPDLPIPVDDGACDGLVGRQIPSLALPSTSGKRVDASGLTGTVVLFCYPHTGRPDVPDPIGWDEIPGARGCTPQACAFRDRFAELRASA
jgi:peroxiredoxin